MRADLLAWLARPGALVLVGLPGAGKTWLRRELCLESGALAVSSDRIWAGQGYRRTVADRQASMRRAAVEAITGAAERREALIVDACSVSIPERYRWLCAIDGRLPVAAVVFAPDGETCRRRRPTLHGLVERRAAE